MTATYTAPYPTTHLPEESWHSTTPFFWGQMFLFCFLKVFCSVWGFFPFVIIIIIIFLNRPFLHSYCLMWVKNSTTKKQDQYFWSAVLTFLLFLLIANDFNWFLYQFCPLWISLLSVCRISMYNELSMNELMNVWQILTAVSQGSSRGHHCCRFKNGGVWK